MPLQLQSWTGVPLAVAPSVTSIHLLSARSVPSLLLQAQLCAPACEVLPENTREGGIMFNKESSFQTPPRRPCQTAYDTQIVYLE